MLRNEFIKNTSLATAGITFLNFPVFGKNAPSNKVVVAVMGVNGRGAFHAESFSIVNIMFHQYYLDLKHSTYIHFNQRI